MSRFVYEVTVIKPGRERSYSELWNKNKRVAEDGTAIDPAGLADTDAVEARNAEEARLQAKQRFPGRTFEIRRLP
jgi:hypothetical protein